MRNIRQYGLCWMVCLECVSVGGNQSCKDAAISGRVGWSPWQHYRSPGWGHRTWLCDGALPALGTQIQIYFWLGLFLLFLNLFFDFLYIVPFTQNVCDTDLPFMCRGPYRSWKVLEFKIRIFQAWKVVKSCLGVSKSWKINQMVATFLNCVPVHQNPSG